MRVVPDLVEGSLVLSRCEEGDRDRAFGRLRDHQRARLRQIGRRRQCLQLPSTASRQLEAIADDKPAFNRPPVFAGNLQALTFLSVPAILGTLC